MSKKIFKLLTALCFVTGCLFLAQSVAAQTRSRVSGTVTDQNGEPVVGVGVFEKGTTNGATWRMAYYLNPIGISHLLLASPTGKDAAASTIYQNPYWPIEADQSATK